LQITASVMLLALSGLALRSLTGRSPSLPAAPSEILLMEENLANVPRSEPRPDDFVRARPLSIVGRPGVLALATGAASLPPVPRAIRIDPIHALREL
jgi:hypothetical protein